MTRKLRDHRGLVNSNESRPVKIVFNGEPRETPENTTIADLLEQLNLASRHVAVEVNLKVVPRGRHAEHVLREGDRLEVVSLVGGG
jgi:sulfur carrier protein